MAQSKSPISLLQEILVQQKKSPPIYQEMKSDSDFPYKCGLVMENITAYGYAHTKKEAKHKCAQEALLKLGIGSANAFINSVVSPTIVDPCNNIIQNYIGELNEQASRNQVPYPTYQDKFPRNGWFVCECQFLNHTTEGVGQNKKTAKREASKNMLEKLKNNDIDFSKHRRVCNPEEDQINMDKILKIYENITITNNEEPTVPKIASEIVLPKCETTCDITLDELIAKLRAIGHQCKRSVLQKTPYIVVLNIDGDCSAVMGIGKNMEEADCDLVSTCKMMFDDGFSFKPYLKTVHNFV